MKAMSHHWWSDDLIQGGKKDFSGDSKKKQNLYITEEEGEMHL